MSGRHSDAVVETIGLTRRFGRRRVIDELDLRIPAGGVHAILGANGAGKSTLFRLLLGFLSPDEGSAALLGCDSRRLRPADRAKTAYLDEEHSLPAWLRIGAVADMHRRQYPGWDERIFAAAIDEHDLSAEHKAGQLSRGERAAFNLALRLAQSPQLMILDEPTIGLDVVAKRAFLETLMYSKAAESCTILYCSHQMDEVERLADSVILLERGRLALSSSPDELCGRIRRWVADIPFKGPPASEVPGLLQAQRIDRLHHYIVIDQGEGFADFLRAHGARQIQSDAVSFERAMNAFMEARAWASAGRAGRTG